MSTPPDTDATSAVPAGGLPSETLRRLEQERDHLLVLHEALAEVERATSIDARLRIFVEAIRVVGFGRVIITLRDAELNATAIVAAGLSAAEERDLRDTPVPGDVWRRRLAAIDRFRISNSYYLEGRDPWVVSEFGGGIPSSLAPTNDPDWSPSDTLLVPLRRANGRLLATLVLDDPAERRRPTLTRVRTVELFAQQVAAMLEQASLVQLAERRAKRLQRLHEVGSLLARSLDEATIHATLARQVEATLPVSSVLIFATDETGAPQPSIYRMRGEERDEATAPLLLLSLAAACARGQRVVRDAALLAVPALLGDAMVGVIVVEGTSGDVLESDDAELLLTIGVQAAAAISNARLYGESQRQRRQTEALADVARAVSESLRIDRVLQLILRHATALSRTDGATIALLRGDTLEVTAGVGAGESLIGIRLPLNGSMSGRAVRTASSIIAADVTRDPDAYGPKVAVAHVKNVIIVPLLSVQGPVGALSVFNRGLPFTIGDVEILQRLADQVAVAVVNARLFEDVAAATREWAVAFDSIGSGMILIDRGGRIQRTNARARVLLDAADDTAILAADFHVALFGYDAPCESCVHLTAIAEGTVQRGFHEDRLHGRIFDVTAAPHPLGGAVITFDDVTEHRSLAERYRLVVETTRDAIVITNRERRITFANPAAHDLFARGPELIGIAAERCVPPELLSDVREADDRAFAGASQSYEGVIMRDDGERRIVAVSSAPLVELGVVTGIVSSMRDITDERRARDAVAQSEARYRNLFESASDAIYTLDVLGAFTSVNEATCELTDRTRDVLLGQSSAPIFDAADLPTVAEHFRRALRGEAVRYECHFCRPGGERRLISVTYTPIRRGDDIIGVLGVARDMTEARARAADLKRSEARYARLVESASDAIFTVDEQGLFTAVNRALEVAIGRAREELIGAPFAELVDERDLADTEALLRSTFAGERSRASVRYKRQGGEIRHGSVITSPVLDDGRIVGALGIMRDVTDEKRLAEQLLQQEKLAAVGQLVSGVAHELNNPLAGVMAFSQLLLASPSLDDEAREGIATIGREAQRAAKIVSNLLTFARQQPAERSAARLNDIVTDTLELRRYALRAAGIAVTLDLDPALPTTWADPFQLQQVVLNLLGNSEHALKDVDGARIDIRTAITRTEVVLSVSDNGPGISADQRDRIFNPFYTTKPVGQGTGLGLSISDGIVREHGGRIRVESTPGEGATFIVELPFVPPPAEKTVADVPQTLAASTPRRVLVVDDEPAMRTAISAFLASLGHAVHVAATGAEARARMAATEYDVVLLDLRMPELGGEALFRELRASDPRHAQRIVFVTGDLESDAARHFIHDTGQPVIGKPFQLDDLAAVIASVTH